MSRAKIITIIILIIFVLFGVYFFFSNKGGNGGSSTDSGFKSFFPFGKQTTNTNNQTTPSDSTTPSDTTPVENPPVVLSSTSKLQQLTNRSVAGMLPVEETRLSKDQPVVDPNAPKVFGVKPPAPKTEVATAVRYMERGTAHIFDIFPDTKQELRVSNTTIPRIHDATFGKDGASVIFRFLDTDNTTIKTYSAQITTAKDLTQGTGTLDLPPLKGAFLADDIPNITISTDGTKMFYLSKFNTGVVGNLSLLDGTKKTTVFDSAFTDWLPRFANSRQVLLVSKASGLALGSAYILDTQTKTYGNILSGVTGLTGLLSPDNKLFLYAVGGTGKMDLNLITVSSKTNTGLNISTLPEKCVWTKDSKTIYCAVPKQLLQNSIYPDAWYQGLESWSDSLYKIDVKSGQVQMIEPLSVGDGIDATNLELNVKENYLVFINKKDSTLWSFDLTPAATGTGKTQ